MLVNEKHLLFPNGQKNKIECMYIDSFGILGLFFILMKALYI